MSTNSCRRKGSATSSDALIANHPSVNLKRGPRKTLPDHPSVVVPASVLARRPPAWSGRAGWAVTRVCSAPNPAHAKRRSRRPRSDKPGSAGQTAVLTKKAEYSACEIVARRPGGGRISPSCPTSHPNVASRRIGRAYQPTSAPGPRATLGSVPTSARAKTPTVGPPRGDGGEAVFGASGGCSFGCRRGVATGGGGSTGPTPSACSSSTSAGGSIPGRGSCSVIVKAITTAEARARARHDGAVSVRVELPASVTRMSSTDQTPAVRLTSPCARTLRCTSPLFPTMRSTSRRRLSASPHPRGASHESSSPWSPGVGAPGAANAGRPRAPSASASASAVELAVHRARRLPGFAGPCGIIARHYRGVLSALQRDGRQHGTSERSDRGRRSASTRTP